MAWFFKYPSSPIWDDNQDDSLTTIAKDLYFILVIDNVTICYSLLLHKINVPSNLNYKPIMDFLLPKSWAQLASK
jgi:hypothetical protein